MYEDISYQFNFPEFIKFRILEYPEYIHIDYIFIDEEYRGKGYSKYALTLIKFNTLIKGKVLTLFFTSELGSNSDFLKNLYSSIGFIEGNLYKYDSDMEKHNMFLI